MSKSKAEAAREARRHTNCIPRGEFIEKTMALSRAKNEEYYRARNAEANAREIRYALFLAESRATALQSLLDLARGDARVLWDAMNPERSAPISTNP